MTGLVVTKGPEARQILECLGRAKGYLRRDALLKSMEAAEQAFLAKEGTNFIGAVKVEVVNAFLEYCVEFNNHLRVREALDSLEIRVREFLPYQEGREPELWKRLHALRVRLEQAEEAARQSEEAQREQRKQTLIGLGREFFESQEYPKGRANLRRLAEEFPDDARVLMDVGGLFLKHDFPADALEYLEDVMQRFPDRDRAYSLAAQAYRLEKKYDKAEAVYLAALRQFGSHPRTLLNMSKLYLEWRKKDKAFDRAKQALEIDPGLTEAREIMERAG